MLSVGLMGAGRIARVHAAVLTSGVVPGVRLAGVCDVRLDRAQQLASRHGVPAFGSLSEMLQGSTGPDAVAVLTESGNHVAHALEVLRSRRHAIVEKPASLATSGVDALIDSERATNRVAVVHQNRFNPAVAALRGLLASGEFGEVVLVSGAVIWGRNDGYYAADSWRGTRALDGGALANQGIHFLDLLLFLFGQVAGVRALTCRNLHKIECEDTVSALLAFKSGVLGSLQVTTATTGDHEGSLTVTATHGYVRLAGECLNKIERWDSGAPRPDLRSDQDYSALGIPSLYGFGHVDFYRDFAESIASGRAFTCTLADARGAIDLLERVYASAAAGGATA